MSYAEFVNNEINRMNANPVKELIKSLKGKSVLVYSHDDPDGIASAVLMTRLLNKVGANVEVKLPETMELEEERLMKDLQDTEYSAVFVLDKATMGYYEEYKKLIKDIVIIDHHPVNGKAPEGILIMNPQLDGSYRSCSASLLVHMLAADMKMDEKYDDFLALVGLKGDWAVEPATDIISEYAKEFYNDRVVGTFDTVIKKVKSSATMFDFQQREYTTILNQITELIFALSGGGFGYLYNDRDVFLKELDHRRFCYDVLYEHAGDFDYDSWKNLSIFMDTSLEPERVKLIFGYYKFDWKKTMNLFTNTSYFTKLGDTDVFLFLGDAVKLMPMAGSIYLRDLKKRATCEDLVLIMINREENGGIHFSLRGTSQKINCGKICHVLAGQLAEKYGQKDQITGGGHYVAAECRTRRSRVSFPQAMEVFSQLVVKIEEAARNIDSGAAAELGLEYIS